MYVCLMVFAVMIIFLFLHSDNDTVIFIDFRADRMRQIVEAVGIKPQFDTDTIPQNLVGVEMGVANHIGVTNFLHACLVFRQQLNLLECLLSGRILLATCVVDSCNSYIRIFGLVCAAFPSTETVVSTVIGNAAFVFVLHLRTHIKAHPISVLGAD